MALELLRCSICPKKPRFSDISHLLTHVGSKGHLAHLHRLQVRGHGEAEAAQELLRYDAWYTEHNLAVLLSERLQQKEARTYRARRVTRRSRSVNIKNSTHVLQNSNAFLRANENSPADAQRHAHEACYQARMIQRQIMLEEMNDPDYIPPLPMLQDKALLPTSSSSGSLLYQKYIEEPADSPKCLEPLQPTWKTPDSTKLKGQIWPGMDIFDAATEDQARRRNQRKDGSVLTIMHANSMRIEPIEETYTIDGTLRRRRHMDELENDCDLLEGEEPMKKLVPRQQRNNRARYQSRRSRIGRRAVGSASSTIDLTPVQTDSTMMNRPSGISDNSSILHLRNSPYAICSMGKTAIRSHGDADQTFTVEMSSMLTPHTLMRVQSGYHPATDLDPIPHPSPWVQPHFLFSPNNSPWKDFYIRSSLTADAAETEVDRDNNFLAVWRQENRSRLQNTETSHFDPLEEVEPELGPLSHIYAFVKTPLRDIPAFYGRSAGSTQLTCHAH